jgi:signal transduction histidine kinase
MADNALYSKVLEEQLLLRTSSLISTHKKELDLKNEDKELRASELNIINLELIFQNQEKEKRAAELVVANIELVYQNGEKEKRAAELNTANMELIFQNNEKESRAAELAIANIELVFQNNEKEKRAAELVIANIELVFQNGEKEKRAAELNIANVELLFQNNEKEKRAAELVIANIELIFQNGEKEKRAAELNVANEELVFQNNEKEKRANELVIANKELVAFNYISSHDLQEPLRKIQLFAERILQTDYGNLSEKGVESFNRMHNAAKRMQILIWDLLAYSKTSNTDRKLESISLDDVIADVKSDLSESITEKSAIINTSNLGSVNINRFQFHQVMTNLITNALKFSKENISPCITISGNNAKGLVFQQENPELTDCSLKPDKNYFHLQFSDNGIGYDPIFKDKIFEVFQRLHGQHEYTGSGIGLAIVKKIIENHCGAITSCSKLGEGATFDIYIPTDN